MADSDINIIIAASVQELTGSLAEAKASVVEFAESVAAALAIREVADFVDSMAKLGTATEGAAAQLGASLGQIQELRAMSQAAGSSAESLVNMMNRLDVAMLQAEKGTSRQAAAAKALGINFKDFMAASPVEKVLQLADAMHKFADGGTKTGDVLLLAGRGAAQNIGFFNQGREAILAWQDALRNAAAVVSDLTIGQLSQLDRNISLMNSTFSALGQTIVAKLSPGLTSFVTMLQRLATEMINSANQGGFMAKALSGLDAVLIDMAIVVTGAAAQLKALWTVASNVASLIGEAFSDVGKIISAAFHFDLGAISDAFEHLKSVAVQKAKETATDVVKVFTDAKRDILQALAGTGNAPPGGGVAPGAPNAPGAQIGGMSNALKDAENQFKIAQDNLKSLADTFTITQVDMTQQLIAQIKIREAAEIKAGEDRKVAESKADAAIAQANLALTQKLVQSWMQMANSISSAFTSQLHGILSGQVTFGQAMENAFAQMIENMIAKLIELIIQYAVLNAAAATFNALTGGSIAGPTLAGLFGKMLGLAEGTPYVTQSGLAVIHQGEAVVPAQANPWGGGGTTNNMGGNVSLNISAIDSRSIAQMFLSNKNVLNAIIAQIARTNPGGVTSFAQAGGL